MKLPNTKNSNHLNSYKKGYRLALDQKDIHFIPGTIQRDPELANYFHEGYQQAQLDQQKLIEADGQSKWHKRFVWIVIMILGGLATATSMINDFEKNRQQTDSDQLPKPTPTKNNLSGQNELSLLSTQQRNDLNLSKQEQIKQAINIKSSLHNSHLIFLSHSLADSHNILLDWKATIPKTTRKIHFQAITNTKPNGLRIQWIFKNVLIKQEKTLPSKNNKDHFKISSSIQLASRWAGEWTIQLIDESNNVIYRNQFNYSKSQ